mmetsp:Transcript_11461/g.11422  ORF Transcript_11461/g.11422 Transcript_11461/m.11422 type:complete len:165 (-) Transcript_11461:104-598(-)
MSCLITKEMLNLLILGLVSTVSQKINSRYSEALLDTWLRRLSANKPYHGGPIDMWALGVILYTLLIGKFPFIGKSESDLYSKIKQGIFSIPDTISFTVRKLLGKMLTLDPVKRPTANELYYEEWIRGDTKCFRKMTLKMINDQYSNNPLVKLVKGDKSNTKSLL